MINLSLIAGARQLMERLREQNQNLAAQVIQRRWRASKNPKKSNENGIKKPSSNENNNIVPMNNYLNQNLNMIWKNSRPKPISGTPPPFDDPVGNDRCDFSVIQKTCSLFGLDLVSFIVTKPF